VEGLEVELELGVDGDDLDPELQTAIYRLVQEALTNVARHARATRVDVGVVREGDEIRIRVADDGAGFDAHRPTEGFGLAGMHERARAMGGTLAVGPGPAGGTMIAVRVPALDGSASAFSADGRPRGAVARSRYMAAFRGLRPRRNGTARSARIKA
jgi:signal transduction histidine kinase